VKGIGELSHAGLGFRLISDSDLQLAIRHRVFLLAPLAAQGEPAAHVRDRATALRAATVDRILQLSAAGSFAFRDRVSFMRPAGELTLLVPVVALAGVAAKLKLVNLLRVRPAPDVTQ
jgi:hypothetical protein